MPVWAYAIAGMLVHLSMVVLAPLAVVGPSRQLIASKSSFGHNIAYAMGTYWSTSGVAYAAHLIYLCHRLPIPLSPAVAPPPLISPDLF